MHAIVKSFLRSSLPARWVLYRVPRADRRVALTFDDGPNPDYTAAISRVLREAGARATFFLVGERAKRYPSLVEQLLADGHELANHSMTHAEFVRLPYSQLAAEIEPPHQLRDLRGAPVLKHRLFRPPKGVLNARVLYYCVRHGHRIVLWSVDPKDFRATSAEQILAFFDGRPLDTGDIVLLHDKTDAMLSALPRLLDRIQRQGLTPVTVSELLAPAASVAA